jgi:hypothetical protein
MLAAGLKSGKIKPSSITPIRIFQKGGKWFSLDNRRLHAFKKAGIDNIPYRLATQKEIINEAWKFTTKTDGLTIKEK